MLVICAALAWETRPVLRALRQVRRLPGLPVRAWLGRNAGGIPVLVFRTGIGPQHAAAAAAAVLDAHPTTAVLNTGCAGAIVPGLTTGTLIVPPSLLNENGVRIALQSDLQEALRATAVAAGLAPNGGTLLTVTAPLATPEAKREAARLHGAVAVDMETTAVARVAADRALPFAALRVVLDEAYTDLSAVAGVVADDGSVRLRPAAAHLLRHPASAAIFARLAHAAGKAEKALAGFFPSFLNSSQIEVFENCLFDPLVR